MVNKYDFYCQPAGENRRLHIYLPDDYYKTDERYPVIYMLDGHNLFFDEDTTFGTCQGMREFMDGYRKKLIIVGIALLSQIHIRTMAVTVWAMSSFSG